MTPDEINRTIAEDRGWKYIGQTMYYKKSVPVFQNLETGEHRFTGLDWLNDANAAHELIEVLRGEGWRVRIEMPEHLGPKDYVRVELFRPSEQRGPYYASTFCRAVCEAYLKVRGKWKSSFYARLN